MTLTAGRVYRATGAGRFSNNTTATVTNWQVRAAAGNSTTNAAVCVATGRTYHSASGGNGQQDAGFTGCFVVPATGTYTIDSYLVGANGAIPAITTDSRGRYDVTLEDAGPIGSVTGLLSL